MIQDKFKDIWYIPSFSAAAGYYKKNTPLHEYCNFRSFFEKDGLADDFYHPYFLISAGIHYKRMNIREEMGLKDAFVVGDSGGYQISKGTMKWDTKLREDIFNWLENNSSAAVNIDIPPRDEYEGKFYEALDFSYDNFKWFNEHQTGKTKFMSVIQGTLPEQYPIWYNKIKGFDFEGWCVGGGTNLARMMYGIATLLQNREFENKKNLYLHFLGQTKPYHLLIYNILQKRFDENGMGHVQVMTDSSTPWKMAIFGNYFVGLDWKNLSYNVLHMTKGLKYNESDPMPCATNCPACKSVQMGLMRDFSTHANHIVAYHNFFTYLKLCKEIKSVVKANTDLLEYMIDSDYYKVIYSLELMLANPEDALKIAEKYKELYVRLSATEKTFTNTNLADQFFE